jgi:hypothetical protein
VLVGAPIRRVATVRAAAESNPRVTRAGGRKEDNSKAGVLGIDDVAWAVAGWLHDDHAVLFCRAPVGVNLIACDWIDFFIEGGFIGAWAFNHFGESIMEDPGVVHQASYYGGYGLAAVRFHFTD